MKIQVVLACFLCGLILAGPGDEVNGQVPTQVVRGRITDAESKAPLPGANVTIMDTDPLQGGITGADGTFIIEKVRVGRHRIRISYVGYKPVEIAEIMVSSGKETMLNIELEEMILTAGEVEIKARLQKDRPIDPMALVGARSFNVDETRRYAGSMDDPMRAVSNFAGVVSNAGVNSNQIMIRGNSPKGLLWRVEGMDIPNPNHFAFVGTSGGGFTIFSSQVLTNSDFYTAAFPAQYSNALSGVFDMRFRNGNNMKHEYAFQIGFQGIDLAAEGPFTKRHTSSYLFNYRLSLLYFLQFIDPWMKNKLPSFQDLSFKINMPTKKAGTFSIVGIGGISRMKSTPEMDSASWETIEDRAQSQLDNRMGALGVIHQVFLSRQTSLRSYISATYNDIVSNDLLIDTGYYLKPMDSTVHRNTGISCSSTLNSKLGSRFTLRTGYRFSMLSYYLDMRSRNPFTGIYGVVASGKGWTDFAEVYAETRIDLTNNLHFTAGLSFRYFLLNGHYGLEPRMAMRWQVTAKHALSAGYGMHSQAEDIGLYLAEVPVTENRESLPNKYLNFSRAQHVVIGYDYLIRSDMRLKTEIYYQYLYDIPVIPGNYFSMINSTGWYTNDSLVNGGTGYNAGVDLTFEKFLMKQFYLLATVSLFDSKYKGGDGIRRNTKFNSGFVVNLLGGKEWTFREKNILGINLKASFTGGEYYVPIDLEQSVASHREILDEANAYASRLPAFFYLDLTLQYRINHKKFCGIWAVQVRNLLNQHPDMGYVYNDFTRSVEAVKSLGIIPLLSYKVEF